MNSYFRQNEDDEDDEVDESLVDFLDDNPIYQTSLEDSYLFFQWFQAEACRPFYISLDIEVDDIDVFFVFTKLSVANKEKLLEKFLNIEYYKNYYKRRFQKLEIQNLDILAEKMCKFYNLFLKDKQTRKKLTSIFDSIFPPELKSGYSESHDATFIDHYFVHKYEQYPDNMKLMSIFVQLFDPRCKEKFFRWLNNYKL